MASIKGVSLHLSELRIVMLGNKAAGKSSSGNTILNREHFKLKRTAQCVKRQGEVAGRQITVVDIPGWYNNYTVEKTTELVKQEIVCSVSLCPPGPQAVLLVIRVDKALTDKNRKSLEGHLGLLSERVWDHTIVLFTYGDCLGDTTIEQHIESEGEALQRLVEKCGNRYHVFNNENRGDVTQVTELLERIEEMVAGNRGRHCEIDREIIDKMEEKREIEKKRGEERLMKVKEQREMLRSLKGVSLHLSELRIVMLGYKTAGKSSSGNTILDREEFKLGRTAQCVKRQGEVAGRQITVVDTPGWWLNYTLKKTTELVKQEIVCSVSLCPPGPHAVLLVIRVDAAFIDKHGKAVEGHLSLLSERVWDHTIVLFTYGDCLGDTTIEQHIESEGEALQRLVEKCGNRYHVFNNDNRGDVTQVTELLEKIEEMVAGNRGGHYEIGASSPSLPLRKEWSMEHPPSMSEEELSERWSLGSSAYGSMFSSRASSVYGLGRSSISTQSSGVGSLRSFQSGGSSVYDSLRSSTSTQSSGVDSLRSFQSGGCSVHGSGRSSSSTQSSGVDSLKSFQLGGSSVYGSGRSSISTQSSGVCSPRSFQSGGSSVYGSGRSSISTQSSGVDSLRSFQSGGSSGSGRRRLKIPNFLRKERTLNEVVESDRHLEKDK